MIYFHAFLLLNMHDYLLPEIFIWAIQLGYFVHHKIIKHNPALICSSIWSHLQLYSISIISFCFLYERKSLLPARAVLSRWSREAQVPVRQVELALVIFCCLATGSVSEWKRAAWADDVAFERQWNGVVTIVCSHRFH